MPVSSIESVNSTSASNIGDLLQEGDFQKGIKIIAFVFLMLLSMLGNALLIAVVYKNANQRMRTPSNYFTYIHTYIHTHTHTRIHTYINTLLHSSPLGALPPYIQELK